MQYDLDIADPSSIYAARVSNMNLLYGLAVHEFAVTQRAERPPDVWEVIGSNPVGDSDFFFLPRS